MRRSSAARGRAPCFRSTAGPSPSTNSPTAPKACGTSTGSRCSSSPQTTTQDAEFDRRGDLHHDRRPGLPVRGEGAGDRRGVAPAPAVPAAMSGAADRRRARFTDNDGNADFYIEIALGSGQGRHDRQSHSMREWQEWRDSNPRPSVLETDALPTELHSCAGSRGSQRGAASAQGHLTTRQADPAAVRPVNTRCVAGR